MATKTNRGAPRTPTSIVDPDYPDRALTINSDGSINVTGGGGGGGSGFTDLLYIDAVNQQFFWQDTGSSTTGLVAYKVQAGAYVAYTPTAPWYPYAVNSVSVSSSALPTGAATSALQTTGNTALAQLHADLIAALPAGTNIIGKVGIDQTTPGTTNGVQLTAGTAIAGKFGIDQTTPGTTNAVALTAGTAIAGKFGIDQTTSGVTNGVVNLAGTALMGKVGIDQTTPGTTNQVSLGNTSAEIAVNTSPPQLLAQPSANSLAALNATVQWQVESGASYILTLTNAPGATAVPVGTVTFQSSLDNATWTSINGTPISTPTAQAASTTSVVGMFLINAPIGATVYLRANATAYTSGTFYALLTPSGMPNAVVPLPWSYTVTSGQTLIGPIDVGGFNELGLQISAVTTTVLTVQGTNDPTLTTWDTIPVQEVKSQSAGAITITAAGTYKAILAGYKWARVQVTTTGTVLTVQGAALRMGPSINLSSFGSAIEAVIASGTITTVTTVTTVATVTSLSQIAASVPQMNIANGSTNKELGVSMATAITQTDVSAGAFAGAGRVNGTIIASAAGSGAWVSAEINVSALTLGTATSVFFILQESRGGTNFTDIWVSDPITTTGIISMPAIPVAGRRRWSAFSVGGTSTTVTVTVTALELPPMGTPLIRQMRDAYAATNPFALTFNSVALTASNFVLSTVSTATTSFYVEGSKIITAFMTLAGGPTVTTQPVVTLQGSMDGTNWVTITGATMTAAGNGTYTVSATNVAFKFARLQVTTAAVFSAGSYTISNIGVNAVN